MIKQTFDSLQQIKFRRKASGAAWSIIRLLILLGVSYVILYPLFSKIVLLFMDKADLIDPTVKWVPRHVTLENIDILIKIIDYFPNLLRSLAVSLIMAILQVISCTLTAYGFSRFRFHGRNILFGLVIATLLVPPQVYIVPLYTQFKDFDIFNIFKTIFPDYSGVILDTLWPFVVLSATGMGIRAGLSIYVLRQSLLALPRELDEAAKVDGAGAFRTFLQVIIPNASSTILLIFLLSFIWQWNDTTYIGFFAPAFDTMAQILSNLSTTVVVFFGDAMYKGSTEYINMLSSGGLLLGTIPIILVFIFCQKGFVQGIERSGLVG